MKHLARNEARASDAYSMTESALNSRQSCCKRSENVMPKSWIPLLVGLVNLLRANPGDLIEHTNFSALKMRPWLQGVLLSFQNLRRRVKRVHDRREIFTWEPLCILFLGVLQTEAPNRPPGGGGSKPEMDI